LSGSFVSVKDVLKRKPVFASAPCRVDVGGTWDIKALALPCKREDPATVNVALDLRTRVHLLPYREGYVRMSSRGFRPEGEARDADTLPFDAPLGLFFAAVSRFGFHGLEVRIESQAPIRSALGGSSTALTALIKALSHLGERLGKRPLPPREVLALGYQLEDALSGGFCGMQDQAAAVYGGVNLWRWRYGSARTPVVRKALLDAQGCREFGRRMIVAHSGVGHDSGRINRGWVEAFLSGRNRKGWSAANRAVHRFAGFLQARDWSGAAESLREEMDIRRDITPDALIPETRRLIEAAEAEGCGARFAGAGGGGAVWATGSLRRVQALRSVWERLLMQMKGGRILHCRVDPRGVRCERLRG